MVNSRVALSVKVTRKKRLRRDAFVRKEVYVLDQVFHSLAWARGQMQQRPLLGADFQPL
jgi:hypothetical protein